MSVDRLKELRSRRRLVAPVASPRQDTIESPSHDDDQQIQMLCEDGSPDVNLQLELYRPIHNLLDKIHENTIQLEYLRGQDIRVVDESQRKKISLDAQDTIAKIMAFAGDIKNALLDIKSLNDEFDCEDGHQNSARSQIRHNLYQATCQHFRDEMAFFTTTRDNFRQTIQDRMIRQIKIVDPDKTDLECLQLVESGNQHTIIAKALASDNLREVVQELRARNQELLLLQHNVETLYEMFKELYYLIDLSGENINVIDQRVANSLDYVQKGEEALKSAKYHQNQVGKLKYLLCMAFLVIFIIVFTPILITSTG